MQHITAWHMLVCMTPHMQCSTLLHMFVTTYAMKHIATYLSHTNKFRKFRRLMPCRHCTCHLGVEWGQCIWYTKFLMSCTTKIICHAHMSCSTFPSILCHADLMPYRTCSAWHIWLCCMAYEGHADMSCSKYTPCDVGWVQISANECGWVQMGAIGCMGAGGHENNASRDKNGLAVHYFGAMAGAISPNIIFYDCNA